MPRKTSSKILKRLVFEIECLKIERQTWKIESWKIFDSPKEKCTTKNKMLKKQWKVKKMKKRKNGLNKSPSKKKSFIKWEMIISLITLKHIFWAYLSFSFIILNLTYIMYFESPFGSNMDIWIEEFFLGEIKINRVFTHFFPKIISLKVSFI